MGSLFDGPEIRPFNPAVPTISTPGMDRALRGATRAARGIKPLSFRGGGLFGRVKGNGLSVTSSRARQNLIRNQRRLFNRQANQYEALRRRVRPGHSELRKARLGEIDDARLAAVGNLRDNFSRRRVLGSSFAEDAVTRGEREFAREKSRASAETFLQEIDLTNQLIGQEFDARRGAVDVGLNEMNLHADLAGRLHSTASSIMTASAQLQSQIAMQEASIRAQLGISQAGLQGDMARLGWDLGVRRAGFDAEAQRGAGEFIGKVAGVGLAPFTGGASLALAV